MDPELLAVRGIHISWSRSDTDLCKRKDIPYNTVARNKKKNHSPGQKTIALYAEMPKRSREESGKVENWLLFLNYHFPYFCFHLSPTTFPHLNLSWWLYSALEVAKRGLKQSEKNFHTCPAWNLQACLHLCHALFLEETMSRPSMLPILDRNYDTMYIIHTHPHTHIASVVKGEFGEYWVKQSQIVIFVFSIGLNTPL